MRNRRNQISQLKKADQVLKNLEPSLLVYSINHISPLMLKVLVADKHQQLKKASPYHLLTWVLIQMSRRAPLRRV